MSRRLGADTVYLTPIFPARSNHRYDASSFAIVDPALGGDDALARLAGAVHGRGMRLIGDLTSNHSGSSHEWFKAAVSDPAAPERGYYYVNDDGTYLSWLGHAGLPKFNMASGPLREIMFGTGDSVVARWLRPPYELDGWRIDVANMTGRSGPHDDNTAVARQIRATIDEVHPGSVLIAEHCHDASGDLTGDGWQGTMNYSGFTRPVWSWLTGPDNRLNFLGVPAGIPRRPGPAIVATMRDFAASVAWKVAVRQWNLLASHDTPRFQTVTGDDAATRVGVALQLTYPGTPMIFAGDEIGLTGTDGEHSRTPFPWDRPGRWNTETFAAYRDLLALRRQHRALRRGGLRWVLDHRRRDRLSPGDRRRATAGGARPVSLARCPPPGLARRRHSSDLLRRGGSHHRWCGPGDSARPARRPHLASRLIDNNPGREDQLPSICDRCDRWQQLHPRRRS